MLPKTLTSRLIQILWDDYGGVIDSFSKVRNWSFRVNVLKSDGTDVFAEFQEKGILTEKYSDGIYLFDRSQEYAIKGSRAFYDGKIYLQSIASMLPVLALDSQSGEYILDVCAAPWSKTTQMAMMMNNLWKIVALEQNQIRYDKLIYNCRLQGATLVEGIKTDAKKFFENTDTFYDKILLDAPCSAEGRISLQNEKSYGFWSLENIQKKSELQYELLSLAFTKLKKWGTLVYSTCTLAPEENEWVVSRFLRENGDAELDTIDIGFSGKPWWREAIMRFEKEVYHPDIQKTVRILPSEETEGFYIAKIGKQ